MLEIEYLQIKDKVLEEITVEEFNDWKYIDCFGNFSEEIQYKEDLERQGLSFPKVGNPIKETYEFDEKLYITVII